MKKLFFVSIMCLVILFGFSNSNATLITAALDELSEQVLSGSNHGLLDFEITNNTSEIWTDFQVRTDVGYIEDGSYIGPGTGFLEDQWTLDITNLNIATGSTLSFSINTGYRGEWGLGQVLYGTPNYSGSHSGSDNEGTSSVPEPSMIIMVGLGLLSMRYFKYKRN